MKHKNKLHGRFLLALFIPLVLFLPPAQGNDSHVLTEKNKTIPELYNLISIKPDIGVTLSAEDIRKVCKEISTSHLQTLCVRAILTDENQKKYYDEHLTLLKKNDTYPTSLDAMMFDGHFQLYDTNTLKKRTKSYNATRSEGRTRKLLALPFILLFLLARRQAHKVTDWYHNRHLTRIEQHIDSLDEDQKKDPATRAAFKEKFKALKHKKETVEHLCNIVPFAFLIAAGIYFFFPYSSTSS